MFRRYLSAAARRPGLLSASAIGVGVCANCFYVESEAEKHERLYCLGVEESSPAVELPRRYIREDIDCYWSKRPVTVVSRVGEVAFELLPVALSCIWELRLSSLVRGTRLKDEASIQRDLAERLRSSLTRLGPAFVKIGQQLSIRPDLLPPPVLYELQRLCDDVEAVSDEVALNLISSELGLESQEQLSEIFDNIHLVASASLGQVYRATVRKTGENVAVKVQRPDMLRRVSLDLFLLQKYGQFLDGLFSIVTNQIPFHDEFIQHFARGSYSELDYELEAANQMRFKRELEQRRCKVLIPSVIQDYTTRRVLTSQWVDGSKLADASPKEIRELIPVGVELFLTQLLDIGAFHADPHPGNLLKTDDGTLCLIDFGLCTEVDEKSRRALTTAIVHLLTGDFDTLVSVDAIELGFLPEGLDTTELKPILKTILTQGLLESGSDLHARKRKLMEISNELNEIFFRYPFSVPPFFALVTRGLGLLEGIALSGDPEFDIFRASFPYARRKAIEMFGVGRLKLRGVHNEDK